MAGPVIQIQHLYKVYRIGTEKVVALSDINLAIERGQVCCIVGTSGSGKSTLLNQLAGLEKPTRGKVLIGQRNISAFSENELARFRQKNIGFIFQSYNLIPTMTALENVSMPLVFRGVSKAKREKASKRIIKEVGLLNRMRHRPSQMSGGQQQRVGIARAFVAKPKIIFADEPTGNLDTRTTIEVMRMMVRLAHENDQTLVIVTHDNEIAEYADRIVTLRDGKIVGDVPNRSLAEREPPPEQPGAEESGAAAPRPDAVPAPEELGEREFPPQQREDQREEESEAEGMEAAATPGEGAQPQEFLQFAPPGELHDAAGEREEGASE